MNLDQRFYLRDSERPAARSAEPPPEYDDERDPAGCTLFMVPVIIFTVAGLGWWFGF